MNWTKTNNRYIAFFDIMGFKNLVSKNSHSIILKKLNALTKLVQGFDKSKFGKKDKPTYIRTVIFSDSIILITDKDTINAGVHIMQLSSMIMTQAMKVGIPIKGCLSHGKFTADFDNSLFFGQPLIDAYLLQEQLHLYSVVLHHTFEFKLKSKRYHKESFEKNIRWFKYKTPLKGGKSWHYHINWIFYFIEEPDRNEYILDKTKNFYNTSSGTIRQYVDNTEDFVIALSDYNT